MKTILVLNGSNLNLLGVHKPAVLGPQSLADVEAVCAAACSAHGFALDFRQSNYEGVLLEALQEAGHAQASGTLAGVVFNAGAYSHTSIALHDAILGSGLTVVELNFANIHTREPFRHHSYITLVAKAVIGGFGVEGYALAIAGLAAMDKVNDPGR
jgi:3-dehydroquinate dehydratase-2